MDKNNGVMALIAASMYNNRSSEEALRSITDEELSSLYALVYDEQGRRIKEAVAACKYPEPTEEEKIMWVSGPRTAVFTYRRRCMDEGVYMNLRTVLAVFHKV